MTNKGSKATRGKQGTVQVRLKWGSSEGLETVYVNHLHITHAGSEFYLVFGELTMPVLIGEQEVPEELEIVPKVRLAISPEAMRSVARAIQDNVEKSNGKEEQ